MEKNESKRLRRVAIIYSVLFVLDLFIVGQGALSLFVAFVGLILYLPGALWAWLRHNASAARYKSWRTAMCLLLGLAAFGIMQFHTYTAQNHSANIIAACEAYKARQGGYPDDLRKLVPDFLPEIPPARYTLLYGDFKYLIRDESHTLLYHSLPPFERQLYNLEKRRWSQVD